MLFVLVACTNKQDDNLDNKEQLQDSQQEDETLDNEAQSTEQEKEEVKRYWVKGTTVNLRNTPASNGEVLGQLTRGTEIIKKGETGDWLHISCGEVEGFIHKDYVSTYLPVGSVEGEVYIIVKKAERLLELWQGETQIISVPIGLGWAPEEHKQVEGDGKTPEGEYYVCVRNSNSAYYLSLGVSYPDKEDAEAALADGRIDNTTYERIASAIDAGQQPDWNTALGGAIMIHGHGAASDWTAGCIAVENEVMDILFEYCPLRTRITILP